MFTSGKIKGMSSLIEKITLTMVEGFEEEMAKSGRLDLKAMFGKFSMDSIATCAFGIDAQSFTNSESQFVSYARETFRRDKSEIFKFLVMSMPGGKKLVNSLGYAVSKIEPTMFFYNVIKATVEHRLKSKERRNDLVDLMLDAMKDDGSGGAHDAHDDELDQYDRDAILDHKAKHKEFDLTTLAATALIILVAGYDTTGMTLGFAAYSLALNPEVQDRLISEIDDARDKAGGKIPPYTAVQEMTYLDMVLHETLRRFTPLAALNRVCTAKEGYTLAEVGYPEVRINYGEDVLVNVNGIHMDPKHYPDPEKFDPERFSKEERAKRHP